MWSVVVAMVATGILIMPVMMLLLVVMAMLVMALLKAPPYLLVSKLAYTQGELINRTL